MSNTPSLRERWRVFPRLLGLIWSFSRRDALLLMAFALGGGALPVLTLTLTLRLVDQAVLVLGGAAPLASVLGWLGGLFAVSLLESLFGAAHEQFKDSMLDRLRTSAHEQLLTKVSRLSLAAFEQPERYDQLHRAQLGLDQRFWSTMTNLIPMPLHLVTMVGLLLYVGAAHPLFPALLLLGMLPVVAIRWREDRLRYELTRAHTASERQLSYLERLILERPAAAEIRLFGLDSFFQDKWSALFGRLRGERLGRARAELRALALPVLGEQLVYSAVIVGVVALVVLGRLSVGALVAYLGAVERFVAAAFALLTALTSTDTDLRYLGDMIEYLDLDEEAGTAGPALPDSQAVPAIVFEDVWFGYPGGEPVLRGISFTLRPGERLALVGLNGAGKTTLVKLLLGLYQPTAGRILVDGADLRGLDQQRWRGRVAAVFQDYVKYELTARENIGFGDLARLDDQPAIERAAAKSDADAVVAELPQGYDTQLGKTFYQDGQDLSIGQWQKLAVGRAYLREAGVLVLDEPTASLDARAEASVYERFRDMAQDRSVLLISHRLGSVRLANRILVLEHGQIVEQGRHAELMTLGGVYANLFSIQAEWYRPA
ncbi:MAG TPA: ABC transporter ATP-binding protein [Roseiflexaceae bacterium]|nr:ABC transporter ATP-binding protein [Roseiflexaceae bacterium]